MSKLQEKPSALKRGHPALQNKKFLNFFLLFVDHFCPAGSGSGFTDLIESGSETLGKAKHMKTALFEKKITDWIEKTETMKSNV
jgi:hypothetical protein